MKRKQPYSGLFLPRDGSAAGQLKLAERDTELKLVGAQMRARTNVEYEDIHGVLNDGRKASLLDCVFHGETIHSLEDRRQYEADYHPNFVVIGNEYLESDEAAIRSVTYHFENVDHLVNGHGSFRWLHSTPEQALELLKSDHARGEEIAKKNGWEKGEFNPEIGEHPHLMYYSGKWLIVETETDLGKVSLVNRASHGMGSAKGIGIENEVSAVIDFDSPKTVNEVVRALYRLHGLFELVLGGRQRYKWIQLELIHRLKGDERELYEHADLYWSNCNERVDEDFTGNWALLSPDLRKEEFSKVLKGWVNTYPEMGDPRERFATAFFGRYGINRIVGAANMFDLLPESHAPKKKELDTETKVAVDQARSIIAALPPEDFSRQSLLSAFGRVGTASLRDKVFHRAEIVIAASCGKFAEIKIPCNHAVLCRNHYVHGSPASFDYTEQFGEFAFITDTLEFVFAVSDLVELGWEFAEWRSRGLTYGHAIAAYMINYDANLDRLKKLITP